MTPKTLKSKVSLVYFSLIFIILMLGVISLWNLTRIGRAVNNIVITNYNSIVSAHNFRKKRAFFVKGATVATKCINKSRTILKRSSGSSLLVLA